MARRCNDNAHELWKALIEKYLVLYEKQESLNGVTNGCNTYMIKDSSQNIDIWYNNLYHLNVNFNKFKEKYEKYEFEKKGHIFDVLTE